METQIETTAHSLLMENSHWNFNRKKNVYTAKTKGHKIRSQFPREYLDKLDARLAIVIDYLLAENVTDDTIYDYKKMSSRLRASAKLWSNQEAIALHLPELLPRHLCMLEISNIYSSSFVNKQAIHISGRGLYVENVNGISVANEGIRNISVAVQHTWLKKSFPGKLDGLLIALDLELPTAMLVEYLKRPIDETEILLPMDIV
jgi:hypothetical protein